MENSLTGVIADAAYFYLSTVTGQIYRADRHYQFKKVVDLAPTRKHDSTFPVIKHMTVYDGALYFSVAGNGIFRYDSNGKLNRVSLSGKPAEGHSYGWIKKVGSSLLAYDDSGELISIKGAMSWPIRYRKAEEAGNFYPLDPGYFLSFVGKTTFWHFVGTGFQSY